VAFLLTIATYYLVERPLRHNRSRWVLPALIAAFLACALSGVLIWRGRICSRPVPAEMSKTPEVVHDRDMLAGWTWVSPEGAKVLLYKAGGDGLQTLVLGDSNAQQYAPRIYELIKGHQPQQRGVQYVTAGGTPPIPGVTNPKVDGCRDMLPTFLDILNKDPRIDRVVIAAWWHGYLCKDSEYRMNGISLGDAVARGYALKSLEDFIRELKQRGKQVIIVTSIPTGRMLDPKYLHARGFLGLYPQKAKSYSKQQFLDANHGFVQDIGIAGQRAGAQVVDPLDFLCDAQGMCVAEDSEGVPIRYDPFHLRPGYVREHVKYLDFTVEP
jgi:hypothetical protein